MRQFPKKNRFAIAKNTIEYFLKLTERDIPSIDMYINIQYD